MFGALSLGMGLGRTRPSPWTPAELGSAVVGWWDASDASTITLNGSNVAAWTSKAGGINASQSTAANQPGYSTSARNSKPGVVAARATDFLTISSISAFPVGSAAATLIVVAYLAGAGSYPDFISYGAAASNQGRYVQGSVTSRNVGMSIYGTDHTTGVPWDIDRIVVSEFLTSSTRRQSVDGVIFNFSGGNMNTSASAGRLLKGADMPIGSVLQDAIVINRALTTDERQKMEGYLAWKWGLSANLAADHPYKNIAPSI